jgi:hypothetical protein
MADLDSEGADVRLIDNWKTELGRLWSVRVAAFWGAVGAIIVILSAYLYSTFDWRVGGLLILVSASFAVARVLKQPGTEA